MKLIKLILFITVTFTLTSCDFVIGGIQGNGNIVTEERVVDETINIVKASNGLEVELVEGTTQLIIVEADENLHDIIETDIRNGVLHIKTTKNIGRAASKKVTVIYNNLEGVEASSGSNVTGMSTVVSNDLYLKASSGANLEMNVLAKELTAQSSSGSDIKIKGQARNFGARSSSGSAINAKDLIVLHANAKASSGAGITLNIENSLEAKASSGGDIKYYGEPEEVSKNNSSSGSVRKM